MVKSTTGLATWSYMFSNFEERIVTLVARFDKCFNVGGGDYAGK